MTILARRFTIICLAFLVFALAMTMLVENAARRSPAGAFELSAPCPQPEGGLCKTTF